MEEDILVVVIEGGMVTDVHAGNANLKVIVIDLDNKKVGEDSLTEFSWPETQFDDDEVKNLLGIEYQEYFNEEF